MLTHRPVQKEDVYFLCQFPQSAEELFFLFPKATYPLTPEQLQDAIDQRFDSTVVLWEGCLPDSPISTSANRGKNATSAM